MTENVVTDVLRRLLDDWKKARWEELSELHSAIVRAYQVQIWFQRNRGIPMVRQDCGPCGKERLFTIWSDGRYHCLSCIYSQTAWHRTGPIPIAVETEVMREFASSWLAYRRRVETFEEPWLAPGSSASRLSRLWRLNPPPICEIGECGPCEGLRPFMRREDGDAGCIHCLMQGRIVEFEIVFDETAAA